MRTTYESVSRVADPINCRIAHVDVRAAHVDLEAKHVGAIGELAGAHAREQVEVLGDRSVAIGAIAARLR